MESKPPNRDRLAQQIDGLAARFGAPVRELIHIPQVNRSVGPAGFPLSSRRTAEVVLIIPRPDRKVLVHTKSFYPSGVWRLPTGGLHRGERIDDAIRREAREETGNELLPFRFLFHLRFRWEGAAKQFDSYGFLTTEASERIESRDPREQITAFHDAGREEFDLDHAYPGRDDGVMVFVGALSSRPPPIASPTLVQDGRAGRSRPRQRRDPGFPYAFPMTAFETM